MLWRRSTLWMTGITALALTGVGAGCSTDDDAAVEAQWDVAYVGGQRISCEDAGTAWVRLDLKSRRNVGTFSFDFPCASGAGLTTDVPAGAYDITLSLLDERMRPVSQISGAYEVGRYGRTRLDLIQFQVLAWQVSWNIKQKPANMPERIASCADVGVKTIEFITALGSEEPDRYPFDCNPGLGLTHAVRSGSYSYQVRALDATGQALMTMPVESRVLGDKLPNIMATFTFP
jgi:hypothetical protein